MSASESVDPAQSPVASGATRRRRMSARPAAWTSLVLGLASVAAIPAAAVVSANRDDIGLLEAELVGVPVAFVLGLVAVSAARRARYRLDRSVRRVGATTVRLARIVAWTGLYLAVTGGLALAFYGVLRASS
jgi:hypothetical protein